MITAVLLISLIFSLFVAIAGVILYAILKLMGYEPTDLAEDWEDDEE